MPITTIISEFAFNTGGKVFTDYRNSLSTTTTTTVEALIYGESWTRNASKLPSKINVNH